ncbi:MAG: hypothetical protein M3P51_09395, partial [Chloroflexota bacterium]|nr:hypothetical protein [Chloroflexota bacterium]
MEPLRRHLCRWQRAGEVASLPSLTPERLQSSQLLGGLDALREHAHTHALAQRNDGLNEYLDFRAL